MSEIYSSGKPLTQTEIDTLLEWKMPDLEVPQDEPDFSLASLTKRMPQGRMPMLEILLDRFAKKLSLTLRTFTSESIEVVYDSMQSVRFSDYLAAVEIPSMACVFRAKEWDSQGIIVISSPFIYSIVDVLMGGKRRQNQVQIEGRPYTTIERRIIEQVSSMILNDFSLSFAPSLSVHFDFERLDTDPRFATISREDSATLMAKFHIDMNGRGGDIFLVLPYTTLEPAKEILFQHFLDEKGGKDLAWKESMEKTIWKIEASLCAQFSCGNFLLSDVLKWKVGERILLNTGQDLNVDVCCRDFRLFSGVIGQKLGYVAIRIEENYLKNYEAKGKNYAA